MNAVFEGVDDLLATICRDVECVDYEPTCSSSHVGFVISIFMHSGSIVKF